MAMVMTEENRPQVPAGVVRRASVPADAPDAAERLAEMLGPGLDVALVFASPASDIGALMPALDAAFGPVPVVGCTTGGEISEAGYVEGQIVAIGLPRCAFRTRRVLLPDLVTPEPPDRLVHQIQTARQEMMRDMPAWGHEFAFLMIDGMSRREDAVAAQLAGILGAVPLFGGSAGDMDRFGDTFIFHDGAARKNAAVLLLVRTACPVKVFRLDHYEATATRMVVTGADPERRVVTGINAEPAAREYARVLGKDPGQLTPLFFAAHPVVVRLGGQHHVRSIQRVAPNGDLHFFSAIDEGLVLTLAEPRDMVDHLRDELEALSDGGAPDMILGCDCMLRKLEALERQKLGALSDLLTRHRVTGFSTYGEQHGSMHVNQTLTGVAIYPPPDMTGSLTGGQDAGHQE